MSVSIARIPDFNPVRNPVEVAMSATGPVGTPGNPPDWIIEAVGSPAPSGQTITLTFGTVVLVFTQAGTPNPLLGQYDGATTVLIADALEDALAANAFISSHYYVVRLNSTTIRLLGFDVGTAYGLTDSVITDNSPAIFGISVYGTGGLAGIADIITPNYGVLLQLWVEETFLSETYTLKMKEAYPVNASNQAGCDIGRALRAYLPSPYMPSPSLVHPARMVGSFRRFLVKAGERYGNPAVTYGLVRTDGLFAYLAGRSEVARTNDPEWEDQLSDGGLQKFLTNWPNTDELRPKRVGVDQREFLCMVVEADTLHLRLKADTYYTDYTMATMVNLDTYLGEDDVVRGEMVIFPVGVGQQNIEDVVAGKTLERYCVYVTDSANTVLTEKRWYVVDREHREYYRQFHYMNTPGGFDTLAFFGPRSQEVRVNMQRANRYVPHTPSDILDARDNADVLDTLDVVQELGTEHLNQDEMEALRDLVGSERIMERVGDEHWPVQVLDSKLKLDDEGGGKGPVNLKYRYALRNNANTLQQ